MRWLLAVAVLLLGCQATRVPTQSPEDLDRQFLLSIRARTVKVKTYCDGRPYAQGTGVLLGGGKVATAAHVIPPGCVAKVKGKLGVTTGRDVTTDVAVIDVAGLVSPKIAYVPPYLGQEVFCVGYAHQVYSGESAEQVSRGSVIVEYKVQRRIRVSCSFQKGASGGPVLDRSGNLVGLMTSMLEPLPGLTAVDQFIVSPSKAIEELLNH